MPDAQRAFRPGGESARLRVQNQAPAESVEWLSDTSPKDKPWDIRHAEGKVVATLYRQSERPDFQRRAERMEKCSPCLEFGETVDPETGEVGYKLFQAYFCRVRTCPTCSWRKSLRWKARMWEALPQIETDYPSHRWLFLTLTVRNPTMAHLKATLKAMRAGWRNLIRYQQWPGVGGIRSMEVTHGEDGRPHPHFHALLLVPASYFSHNYLKHSKWVELWRKAMKLDYDPSVRIQPVKAREGDAHPMHRAIAECLKYSVKPSDLTSDAEWLYAITDQLHGSRAVEVFGALKPYLAEAEEEDLVNLSEDGAENPAGNEGGVFFNYYDSFERFGRPRNWSPGGKRNG